jgi:hypothetical protein
VAESLMRFREVDDEGRLFSSGPRCRDHRACADRYQARYGERWPLEDPR